MRTILLSSLLLAVLAVSATAALATDEPPPPTSPGAAAPGQPQPLQPAPAIGAARGVLQGCRDATRPSSGLGKAWARRALRGRVLRGSARDQGCGVAMVAVSVVRRAGKRCRYLVAPGRLSRPTRCGGGHWLLATGTTRWRVALPRSLPRGRYLIRTRAIDFAGNVERVAGRPSRKLRLR